MIYGTVDILHSSDDEIGLNKVLANSFQQSWVV